ncbi:hypothetical protein [Psychroserpens sp. SPM9]|uniref:FEKKY domain-containing protein n=1 Tax=Psychroserpens sp. SPM9 TaxID=2975598 RepID=UPI0021A262AA|nr:hypothetical protein [Psychroserpens sp. SPM9]MDG5493243.1 hypothetical protein [Psychroserpens sp. SPM9]
MIAKILFVIGFISFILYFLAKNWRKVLTKIMLLTFSISLILSVYLSYQYYEWNKYVETKIEYEKYNCDELKKQFEADLKSGGIKYFQYGMGPDNELHKNLKEKYGIQCYSMGCMKFSPIDCYNDLVNNYLIEKHNDSIVNGR